MKRKESFVSDKKKTQKKNQKRVADFSKKVKAEAAKKKPEKGCCDETCCIF